MKVFFFGAGASKASGLLLTSELLPALYHPERFGIDPSRSKYQRVSDKFKWDRELCLSFIESIRRDSTSEHNLLNEIFSAIANCELSGSGLGGFSFEKMEEVKNAFYDVFHVLLNPAYAFHNLTHYMNFFDWAYQQQEWIVVATTNWDYLLDEAMEVAYFAGRIDREPIGLPLDEFIPVRMTTIQGNSDKYGSLYKLNGSLNWLYCSNDNSFYGKGFQGPFSLDYVINSQNWQKILFSIEHPGVEVPRPLRVGYCPVCGTHLTYKLYTPGVSRDTFPMAPRLLSNLYFAVANCTELVFVGFSCPPEDKDIVSNIGIALKENPLFQNNALRPVVIQSPEADKEAIVQRYEHVLNCPIDYRNEGFAAWAESLSHGLSDFSF